MSKVLYAFLSHELDVALGKVDTDESGGVEVVGEYGGLREVEGQS
jgi:hypothetical protein